MFKYSGYGDSYDNSNYDITDGDIDNNNESCYHYVYANQYINNDRTDYSERNSNVACFSHLHNYISGNYHLHNNQDNDGYGDNDQDADIHLYNDAGIPVAGVHHDYCNQHQDGNDHCYNDGIAAVGYINRKV